MRWVLRELSARGERTVVAIAPANERGEMAEGPETDGGVTSEAEERARGS